MMPSLPIQLRIESIVSSTDRMKQAELCGFSRVPMLNHTGELNAIFCWTSRWVSSASNVSASTTSAKYPSSSPHLRSVDTIRSMSCRMLDSRRGEPSCPRKYFEATTLVASCDQSLGTSMSSCSNTGLTALGLNARGALLPLDLVVRMDAGGGEMPVQRKACTWHRRKPARRRAGWTSVSALLIG